MSTLHQATVLITGGAQGIGRLMGELCLSKGAARLIIWDIDRLQTEVTITALQQQGYEVHSYHVDLSNINQISTAAADVRAKWGGVDILFNNAGIITGNRLFHQFTHDEIERTMQINTSALMHVALEFLPGMVERKKGHIVNIASAAGLIANPRLSVYCASKHAVVGWSESLRMELEQVGGDLHVTTVTPSYISTSMFAGVRSPLVPIVQPQAAARAIIRGVQRNRVFVRMPWLVYAVPFYKGILPVRWMDFLTGKLFGFYKSMDTFRGRNS